MEEFKVVQNVEITDLVGFIRRKGKLHQKLILDAVEEVLGRDTPEYTKLRKIVLDNTNDFSRSVVKAIFGDDFEGKF